MILKLGNSSMLLELSRGRLTFEGETVGELVYLQTRFGTEIC